MNSINFISFLKIKYMLWIMQNLWLKWNGWVFVQPPIHSLMFLIQIRNVLLLDEIILHCGFSDIHTKLFCACHKFVWRCALNSIESKCDLSKIVKFKVHIMTCKLVTQDLVGHVLIHYSFRCVFDGKNIVPPHQAMCAIIWLKRWPNIFIWSILHVFGHCNDHWDHRHNHTYKTYLW